MANVTLQLHLDRLLRSGAGNAELTSCGTETTFGLAGAFWNNRRAAALIILIRQLDPKRDLFFALQLRQVGPMQVLRDLIR